MLEQKKFFNEEYAQYLKEIAGKRNYPDFEEWKSIPKNLLFKNFCIDCGIEITRGALRCEKCRYIADRRIRPSREKLKEMIRTLPFTKIGEKYHVTDNAIRKWCDAENLPRTKKEINLYSDEEWNNI